MYQNDVDAIKSALIRLCDHLQRHQALLGASEGIRRAAEEEGLDWERHSAEAMASLHDVHQWAASLGGGPFGEAARMILTSPQWKELAALLRLLAVEEGYSDEATPDDIALGRLLYDRFSATHPNAYRTLLRKPPDTLEGLRRRMNDPPTSEAPYWWQLEPSAPARP